MKVDIMDFKTWSFASPDFLMRDILLNGRTVYIYEQGSIDSCSVGAFFLFMTWHFDFYEKNGKILTLEKKNKLIYSLLLKLANYSTNIEEIKKSPKKYFIENIDSIVFENMPDFEETKDNDKKILLELDEINREVKKDVLFLKVSKDEILTCRQNLYEKKVFDITDFNTWNYPDEEMLNSSLVINGKYIYIFDKGNVIKCSLRYLLLFLKDIKQLLSKKRIITVEQMSNITNFCLNNLLTYNTDIRKLKKVDNSLNLNSCIEELIFENSSQFKTYNPESQKNNHAMDNISKELKNDSKLEMSNEVYCDYHLTLAQATMLKDCSIEEKEKICRIVQKCKTEKLGKNKLRQMIFDNHCDIDNYLFADLVYCFSKKEEYSIMFEYYSGFDIDNFDGIREDSYIKKYPQIYEDLKETENKIINGYSHEELKSFISHEEFKNDFINVKDVVQNAIQRGSYNSNVQIDEKYMKSYAVYKSIKENEVLGYLTEYEICRILESIHNDICLATMIKKLDTKELRDIANKNLLILPDIKVDFSYIRYILEPFQLERQSNLIHNRYFSYIKNQLYAFQYHPIFDPDNKEAERILAVWNEQDTEILKNICGKVSYPSLHVASSFFELYFSETRRLEKIMSGCTDKFYRVFNNFAHYLGKYENLVFGVCIKKNKATGEICVDRNKAGYYSPCPAKLPNVVDEDLSKLKLYAELIGKCPNIKELDYPVFNIFNEVEIKNFWMGLPESKYYKEKYGSIRNAYNLVKEKK